MEEQLLLPLDTKEERLFREFDNLKIMIDKHRKSTYAKIGAVKKENDELKAELFMLKKAICRGQKLINEDLF